jgi:RNA polymerase sigma factor (TIGR02999 family)
MYSSDSVPVTALLLGWGAGESECLDGLVVPGLRRIAHHLMRGERQGHTLQTTALVNEAYRKLVDKSRANWQSRAHFVGVAATLMRRILVDHARGLQRNKRGGAAGHLFLDEGFVFPPAKSAALIAPDDALEDLAKMDPRKAQVVNLRYFGGLSVEAAAEALHVHPNTVIRDWTWRASGSSGS